MSPRLSVIMTVRNGARYLPETLAAIAGQTFGDYELIINDNGSTDDTPHILARYAAQDRRVRLLANPAGGTFTHGIQRALLAARAPLVAVNDGDDVPAATRLEKQVALLDAQPDVVLVTSWFDNIDAQGRTVTSHRLPATHAGLVDLAPRRNLVAHSSVMYRRDKASEAGGYQERFSFASDFALQLAMVARGGKLAVIPERLVKVRLHQAQTSLMSGKRTHFYHEMLEVFRLASRLPDVSWPTRCRGMLHRQNLALHYGAALWRDGHRMDSVVRTAYWLSASLSSLMATTPGQGTRERVAKGSS